jgi:hypothetical protein
MIGFHIHGQSPLQNVPDSSSTPFVNHNNGYVTIGPYNVRMYVNDIYIYVNLKIRK